MDPISPTACSAGRDDSLFWTLAALGLAATSLAVGVLGVRRPRPATSLDAQRSQRAGAGGRADGHRRQAAAAADAHAAARGACAGAAAADRRDHAALREARAARAEAVERLSDRLVALYTARSPPSWSRCSSPRAASTAASTPSARSRPSASGDAASSPHSGANRGLASARRRAELAERPGRGRAAVAASAGPLAELRDA